MPSLVACKEMAKFTPISSPARTIIGTTPAVESVIRLLENPSPSGSKAISIACFTLSKL